MTDQDEVFDILDDEIKRQQEGLELIASENYVSSDVLKAQGSIFTNKYSEGYPGRRYYGGQDNTDRVEQLAIDRAKKLFRADHANVQPHSGAQANEVVYHAWAEPGDTILAMDLSHGGHLTHGHPVTVLAQTFNFVRYGMKDTTTGEIDYDELARLADEHKPKIILAGFSAYPRELDYTKFASIGNECGALLVADMAHIAGLIAGGVLENPLDHGFHIITTTTHKTLRGPRGGMILSQGRVSNPLKAPEKTIENIPTLIDRTLFPGIQGGPMMHTIMAKAVALGEALRPEFHEYCKQVIKNAQVLADELKDRGFSLVTGGTDNHLILIDMVESRGIDGAAAEETLDRVGLTCSKNQIPDDANPPFRPSGLRIGTPAITTRDMGEEEMREIARIIDDAITYREDEQALVKLKEQVVDQTRNFPLPS
ncbi:MAG: serine hydroxymethyltransferase [Patescibacteria group bacterium]